MPYLIDGYNLLFHLYPDEDSIDIAREELINYLKNTCPKKTLLIFDNSHPCPNFPTRHRRGHLEVIHAPGSQTADHYIIEYLQAKKYPKSYTVVTADKEIIMHAKEYGAKIESPEEFCKHLKQKNVRSEKPTRDTPDEISRLLDHFEE